jgi:hypothetical protein
MTRILHLILGPEGADLSPVLAADLVALSGVTGLQLARTGWLGQNRELPGHEALRARSDDTALRLACMAEHLLRDHGGRSMPALLAGGLTVTGLCAGSVALLSWAEVLEGLRAAFLAAGADLHLQVWLLHLPETAGQDLPDLVAALAAQGFAVTAGGVLQPDPASDLAQHLSAAVRVNDLAARIAARAGAAGLCLTSGPRLRMQATRHLARLAAAGLAPDPATPEALDRLAASWLRSLLDGASSLESL